MEFEELIKKASDNMRNGNIKKALEIYQESLNLADSDEKKARVLRGIARTYIADGKMYKAQGILTDALNLALKSGNANITTEIYIALIDLFDRLGEVKISDKYIKEGRKYADKSEESEKFNFYNIVAIHSFNTGKIGLAENYWKKCLEIGEKINDKNLLSIAYNNVGEVYRLRGDYQKALEFYKRAYEVGKEIKNYEGMAVNLLNMGMIEKIRKNFESGEKYLMESLELYKKHKNKIRAAAAHREFAMLLADEGKYDNGIKHAEEGLKIVENLGNTQRIGELTLALGYVYEKKGDLKIALSMYNKAKKIFTETENKVMLSECELYIGRVFLLAGKKDTAEFHLRKARDIAMEIGKFRTLQMANSLLAKC